MSRRIYIVDTNVLAAGLMTAEPTSPTARILDSMLNGSILYLLSSELLFEYREVLLRPGLTRLHGLNELEIEQILAEVTANAIWREAPPDAGHASPDPNDAHLWALLASESAAVLITGDQLLLKNPKPGTSVISPRTWAEHFTG